MIFTAWIFTLLFLFQPAIMIRQFFLLPCLIFYYTNLFAQETLQDAAAVGKGGTLSLSAKQEAIWGNPSGLAEARQYTFSICSDIPFGMPELSTHSLGVSVPYKENVVAFSFTNFGNNFFSRNTTSVILARNIDFVNLGLRTNIQHFTIPEYGSSTVFSFDFGGQASLSEKLIYGAYISNFTVSKISRKSPQNLPVEMALGLSWQPLKQALFNAEIYKESGYKLEIKSGIEYSASNNLSLRLGYRSSQLFYAGIGLKAGKFTFSYATSWHQYLPLSHFFTGYWQVK